jgi:hypothetical protein
VGPGYGRSIPLLQLLLLRHELVLLLDLLLLIVQLLLRLMLSHSVGGRRARVNEGMRMRS